MISEHKHRGLLWFLLVTTIIGVAIAETDTTPAIEEAITASTGPYYVV